MGVFLEGFAGGGKKEGQYAWKKYDAPHFTLTFTVTNSSSPFNLRVDCAEVDLSTVDASWFVGIKGVWNGNGYYEFPNESTLRIFDATNTYNFASTWNASTQSFTVTSATGIGNTSQFADYVADGQFMSLVVSADESDYPNGGERDGYWYELVEEGIDLLAITGCTKMAVNKFTFSTRTEIKSAGTIKHSLGEMPKIVILLSSVLSRQDSNYIFAFYMPISGYSYNLTGARSTQYQGSYSVSVENLNATSSGIFKSSTGGYFEAGEEYTLITMA